MGTIDSLLAEHVSFRCTSVDRIGTRGYVPGLQYEGGVVKFLFKRGFPIPSPAALNKAQERYVELVVLRHQVRTLERQLHRQIGRAHV